MPLLFQRRFRSVLVAIAVAVAVFAGFGLWYLRSWIQARENQPQTVAVLPDGQRLVKQPWHKNLPGWEQYHGEMIFVVAFEKIQKIKPGMTLSEVAQRLFDGFPPTTLENYPSHPDFASLATDVDGKHFQVGLLHKGGSTVLDVSFRETKKPREAKAKGT